MSEHKIKRRSVLYWTAVIGAAALIPGCAPPDPNATFALLAGTPTPITKVLPPEMSIFSVLTRLSPAQIVGFSSVGNQEQRQLLSAMFIENSTHTAGGEVKLRQIAIDQGFAIGKAGCSDSRICGRPQFPIEVEGIASEQMLTGRVIEVNRVGVQPAVFPDGVNMSVFSPHQTCVGVSKGCGLLGGIDVILSQGEAGEKLLKSKGITELTIQEIKRVIGLGANSQPEDWARVGARIQANMNASAHKKSHFVMYGVEGHADDMFRVGGIVDEAGNVYDVADPRFRLLKSYGDFINQPHALLEEIAAGQAPSINHVNLSRDKSSQDVLGKFGMEKGKVFSSDVIAKIPGQALTAEESLQLLGGNDYSLAHLMQREKILLITADTEADLTTFRKIMLTEGRTRGALNTFLESGGLVVESTVDANGKFYGVLRIRNMESMVAEMVSVDSALKGIVSTDIPVTPALMKEAQDITNAQVASGKVGNSSIIERAKVLWKQIAKFGRPMGTVLKYVLQSAGDIATVLEMAQFVNEDIKQYTLTYKNKATLNRTIFLGRNHRQFETRELPVLTEKYHGGNPYLLTGGIEKVVLHQDDLKNAYAAALRAFMDHGPHGNKPDSPWKDLTADQLGKALVVEVPTFAYDGVAGGMENHAFFLTIRPEQMTGSRIFVQRDQNQVMQLDDTMTGMPVFGSIDAPPQIVSSFNPKKPDLIYFWQIVANPRSRTFELRCIDALPIEQ